MPKRVIFIPLFGIFLLSFTQVNANFLDFVERMLGKTYEASSNMASSQTIPVLIAPPNLNGVLAMGGGDINIVQGSALLPVTGPLGSIADVEGHKSDAISLYVVKEGDSISEIAEVFDVSVNTIRWANNLGGNSISPGQVLVILPITGVQYKIQKGDTLAGIAKKFGGDAEEIAIFNDISISSSAMEIGSTIIIPNGEASSPEPKKTTASKKLPSRAAKVSGPAYSGYYIRPISGGVRTQGIHGYNGVDLANSCGTPIVASAEGDVIIARSNGWNSGYGQYVVISHANGTQSLYAHMSLVITSPGFHVAQGQVIGYVGSTGLSTGCHIHFEIRGAKNPF